MKSIHCIDLCRKVEFSTRTRYNVLSCFSTWTRYRVHVENFVVSSSCRKPYFLTWTAYIVLSSCLKFSFGVLIFFWFFSVYFCFIFVLLLFYCKFITCTKTFFVAYDPNRKLKYLTGHFPTSDNINWNMLRIFFLHIPNFFKYKMR